CNTNEAPRSSLRVGGAHDRPKGYIPPLDDMDIELTMGMKFGESESDQGRKVAHAADPGALPKTIPKLGDAETADSGSLGSKGHSNIYSGKRKGGHGQSGSSDTKAASSASAAAAAASQTLTLLQHAVMAKAALRHALFKVTDARREQLFKLHVYRPNRQVHDAICTGNFRRRRGMIATRTIPKPFRRNDSHAPGSDDDAPAADNGTGSDDDVAAQTQHWYPTRRRTGCAPAGNVQQQ
ncbi:hypothetical protein GGI22_006286, partial [Coemansia erecta]